MTTPEPNAGGQDGVAGVYDDYDLGGLAAELKERLGRPSPDDRAFFAGATSQIERRFRDGDRKTRIHSLLDVATFFHNDGREPHRGIEACAAAVALARSAVDRSLLRKALTYQGVLVHMAGGSASAIENLAEAYEIAHADGDVAGEAFVLLNTGAALVELCQYHDASNVYLSVIIRCDDLPEPTLVRASALANLALCLLFVRDIESGLTAIRRGVDAMGAPMNQASLLARTMAERTYTRLLTRADKLSQAQRRAELASQYASQTSSLRAQIAAATAQAVVDMASGNVDLAMSRISAAVEQARLVKTELHEALTAAVEVALEARQTDLALEFERELTLHLHEDRERRALYHHFLHLRQIDQPERETDDPEENHRRRLRHTVSALVRFSESATLPIDPTGRHVYRVGALVYHLAKAYGCDEQTCYVLELCARLHDIGHLFVPDRVLLQHSPDGHEMKLMQLHTTTGADLLLKSRLPSELAFAETMARYHHEKWDATGYPRGIGRSAIPLPARMVALADAFDALTHDRPHRKALSVQEALALIQGRAGADFDPELTTMFVNVVQKLGAQHGDLEEFLSRGAKESTFLSSRSRLLEAIR